MGSRLGSWKRRWLTTWISDKRCISDGENSPKLISLLQPVMMVPREIQNQFKKNQARLEMNVNGRKWLRASVVEASNHNKIRKKRM